MTIKYKNDYVTRILKALANDMRRQMLDWLKEPEKYFKELQSLEKPSVEAIANLKKYGVCVGLIQMKSQLSQSTTSQYLTILQQAGLIKAKRQGQWTFYSRNEKTIETFKKIFSKGL